MALEGFTQAQQETADFMEVVGFHIVEGPAPTGSYLEKLQALSAAMQQGLISEEDMRSALVREMQRRLTDAERAAL